MDNKKRGLILLVFSIILVTVGATYAYYEAVVHGTGNTNAESSALTATLGEVEFNGVSTFDTSTLTDIYPGFIGIQSFTVSPYRDGYGVYEIDVEATVPAEFGSDIKLTLYKTSDNTNNYLTRQEGTLTQSSIGFSKQDILTIVGDLEKVYEGNLSTTSLGILEQVEFNIVQNEFENPDTTPDGYYTYYAVYEYLDNGVQDAQEGLDFSSKITVRYVAEKTFIPVNGARFFANLASSGEQSDLFYDESSGSYYFSPDSQNNYVYFNNQMPKIVNGYVINYTDMVVGNYESEESCLAGGRDGGPRLGDFTYRCVQGSEGGYDLLVSGYSTDSFVETSEECETELGEWPSEYSSCINKSIPVGWKVIAITNNEVNLNASTSLKLVPLDIEAQKMLSDAYNTNFGIGDYIALDSEVLITGGDGSFENPYRLSIETPIDVLYSWGKINVNNPGVLDYHQLGDNYHGIFIRTIKNNRNVCIIKNDEPVCLDRSASEDVLYDIFGAENCNRITVEPTNASIFADIRPSLLPNVDNDGYSLSKVNSLGNGDINCQNESYRCERNGCITTEGYYCRFNGTCNYNSDGVIGNGFL